MDDLLLNVQQNLVNILYYNNLKACRNNSKLMKTQNALIISSEIRQEQRVRKSIASDRLRMRKNKGHWNLEENLKYLVFVDFHRSFFDEATTRDIWRIYKGMSNFVETRDSSQCRSHHQKMLERYSTLEDLITGIRLIFSEDQLKQTLQFYRQNFLEKTFNLKSTRQIAEQRETGLERTRQSFDILVIEDANRRVENEEEQNIQILALRPSIQAQIFPPNLIQIPYNNNGSFYWPYSSCSYPLAWQFNNLFYPPSG